MTPRRSLVLPALGALALSASASAGAQKIPVARLERQASIAGPGTQRDYGLWAFDNLRRNSGEGPGFLVVEGGGRDMIQFLAGDQGSFRGPVLTDLSRTLPEGRYLSYARLGGEGGELAVEGEPRSVSADETFASPDEYGHIPLGVERGGETPASARYRQRGPGSGALHLEVGGVEVVGRVDQAGVGASYQGLVLARVRFEGQPVPPGGATLVLRERSGLLVGVVTSAPTGPGGAPAWQPAVLVSQDWQALSSGPGRIRELEPRVRVEAFLHQPALAEARPCGAEAEEVARCPDLGGPLQLEGEGLLGFSSLD